MTARFHSSIFISYQRDDVAFAEELRSWLQDRGFHPWMDLFDIPAGTYWPDAIDEALQVSEIVIGILSPSSVSSRNVKNEWDWALGNDRQLILLLVEPCDIPHRYYALNYIDFTIGGDEPGFELLGRTLGVSEVKQLSQPAHDQPVASVPVPTRRRVREAPVIVGRERELEQLRGILDRAIDGQGRLVLIGGEAGIGKTTLTTALAVEAEERGALVLEGGCYDLTTTPSYGPWVEVLSTYPDDEFPALPKPVLVGTGLEGIRSQADLFQLAAHFFGSVARQTSIVVLLEDLQWSDSASLDLLRFLGRHSTDWRMLVVATYRDDELTPRHPFYQLLPVLVRESDAQQLKLQRLDSDAIRELITTQYNLSASDESRLLDRFHQLTGGNPFYLVEVLRSLETSHVLRQTEQGWELTDLSQIQIPVLVNQVIDTRLAHLSDEARAALNIAAVIGHEFTFTLWSQVSEIADEPLLDILEEVIGAHVLEETNHADELRFTHALVREAIYDGLIRVRRQIWHRRVAEVLMTITPPDPSSIAHHFHHAGDPRAEEWLVRAAEQAQAVYDAQSTIKYATQAVELAKQLSGAVPADALRIRGAAYETVGDNELARQDYDRLLELSRETADRALEWQALMALGFAWAERDYQQSGEYLRQALTLAREIGDAAMLAHSLNRMGNWYVNLDQPLEALQVHGEALLIFDDLADKAGLADTHDLLAMANLLAGDYPSAYDHVQQAIDLFTELNNRQSLSYALGTKSLLGGTVYSIAELPAAGSIDQWRLAGQQSLEIAREIGDRSAELYARESLGLALSFRGYLSEALAHVEKELHIALEIEHREHLTAGNFTRAYCYYELLDIDKARDYAARCQSLATELGSVFWMRQSTALRVAIGATSGQVEQFREALQNATGPGKTYESSVQKASAFRLAELEFKTGDYQRALNLTDSLIEAAGGVETGRKIPYLAFLHGEIVNGLGRIDEAAEELKAARLAATEYGYRPLRWRIDLALEWLHRSRGDNSAAERSFNDAWSMVEEIAEAITDESQHDHFLRQAKLQFNE